MAISLGYLYQGPPFRSFSSMHFRSVLFEVVTWLASIKPVVSHYAHPLQLNTIEKQASRTW